MADQLYLSYWLRGFGPLNMLREYEKMLQLFPFSKLGLQDTLFRVYAVAYSEPPLLETTIPAPVDVASVIRVAAEFQNADVCYEISASWDLWRFEKEWRLAPSPVQLVCYGPEFETEMSENLRIDFGLEDQFLPSPEAGGVPMIRSNIQSLLRLVHDMDGRLKPEKRLLWSESGENFAEHLQKALAELQVP